MLAQADVDALVASGAAHMHVRAARPDARFPVIKLLPQTTGGIDIQTPDGARRHCRNSAEAITLTADLLGPRQTVRRERAPNFRTRHLDGLHVLFTTDENQCLVLWRTREPGTNEIVTLSSTIWAAAAEGGIEGYDLSPRQRAWLEGLVEAANAWTAELTRRGLNANQGGQPDKAARSVYLPVRTSKGKRQRQVSPD